MIPTLRSPTDDPFALPWPAIAGDEVFCAGMSVRDLDAWWPSAFKRASAGERANAERFLHREDALRHLAGRAACRSLLAAQLAVEGQADLTALEAEFTVNAWGKPALAHGRFDFSISHSGDQVWLAAARAHSVGIDVQQADPRVQAHELGDAFFHPFEAAAIRGSRALGETQATFLRCWVRKEAVVKATGRGLSIPLSAFAVATGGDTTENWLRSPPDLPGFQGPWMTRDLPAPDGYAAAVAAAGAPQRCSVWRIELPAN